MDPIDISSADNDVRYVPEPNRNIDFCGMAHESRYTWVLKTWDLTNNNILDFGCGSGYGVHMLSQKANLVHGLDYSRNAIEFARDKYSSDNTSYFVVDASSKDVFKYLQERTYDFIISFDVIEHIEFYYEYLSNISKLIREDGILIIGSPNKLQTLNWNRNWNPYHHQEFTPRQLYNILSLFFEEVILVSQDFYEQTKREYARLSNYGTDKLLPSINLEMSDIEFRVAPPESIIEEAFGLVAICRRVKEHHSFVKSGSIKILLIEPQYGYKEAMPWVPIGKAYLAATLRENGFNVKIIDQALNSYDLETLIKMITDFSPDIIGIGGMTLQINDTKRIAGYLRNSHNNILLVGGGIHLTLVPEDGIDLFDFIVIGEGESTFLELCQRYKETGFSQDKKFYMDIKGICFKTSTGEIIRTQNREFITNLDKLPLPAYDLLEIEKYNDFLISGEKAVSIMTGRGCPFNCEFCASPALYHRKVRFFSLNYVFCLIEYLRGKYKFKNFRIMDDTFASNKKRVITFCEEIINRGLNLNMTCLTHVKTADAEMFKWMKKAGFTIIALGIESGNDRILKLINKGITIEKASEAIKMARDAGLLVESLFMLGNIGETKETIEDTINFAKKFNPSYHDCKRVGYNWFQFATPFPGSKFFIEAKDYGKVVTFDYDNYTHQIPIFIPNGLDANTMIELREKAFQETEHMVYLSENSISMNSPEDPICLSSISGVDKPSNKLIKVLHVAWGHPPNFSAGPIYYLHQLCLEQLSMNVEPICFVASNEQGDTNQKPSLNQNTYEDIKYHIVGNRPIHYFGWSDPRLEVENPDIELLFSRILEEERPQIVHFHNLVGLSMSLPEIAKKFGCATLFSAHNYWMICPRDDLFSPNEQVCPGPGDGARCASCVNNIEKIEDFMDRTQRAKDILNNSIDIILSVSRKVKRIFAGFGVPKEKIITHHLGSKAAEQNWESTGKTKIKKALPNKVVNFAYFGTLQARKGVHILLEAVRQLKQKKGKFVCEIYGYCPPDPYKKRIEHILSQDAFLQEVVIFKGGYLHNDLPKILQGVDVAIIPPIWEDNGPQTVMETLGGGVPVIGSRIGGIPDFIKDYQNGILFNTGDSEDLAHTMSKVINNKKLIKNLQRGIKEPLTISEHARKLLYLYNKLIKDSIRLQESYSQGGHDKREVNESDHLKTVTSMIDESEVSTSKEPLQPDSDIAIASKNLAMSYYGMGRFEDAYKAYMKLLKDCPDDIDILLELAHLSTVLNHLDEADKFYNQIKEIEKNQIDAVKDNTLTNQTKIDTENDISLQNATKLKRESENFQIKENSSKERGKTSQYDSRLSTELNRYSKVTNVHNLPDIFHYWSHKYLKPKLENIGLRDIFSVFIDPILKLVANHAEHTVTIASLGSGNCDFEINLVKQLRQTNVFVDMHCYEINQDMLDRGIKSATEEGIFEYLRFIRSDINSIHFEQKYDMFMANHSLHHFSNLEHIFESIRKNLNEDGYFVVNDMIGRNGHMRWPEAQEVIDKIWPLLSKEKKWNHQLNRHEEIFINWDCSKDGFEGIRSQDILPLLIKYFKFELFFAFANIISVFIDRGFGHNYDPSDSLDRAFIDYVAELDATLIREGKLKPTQLIAWMKLEEPLIKFMIDGATPTECVRELNHG
jgi:radical SAM superfamily enzyme YgiQ (UPF0313 family)/glycosyltransferase involved in cell wall biosynthesis/2-polyprenyl-3-methyl-5-hydroxy-6-metoxy-1,4-benzoquinol methylase